MDIAAIYLQMGNSAANRVGIEEAPVGLREGGDGIIDKLDKATREKSSGTLITWDGEDIAW
jgi:norsolorinic acid ketoreductase